MTEKELNEKKKEYLNLYKYAIKRERDILDEIQRLRMNKMFPSIVFDDMPHGTECKDLSDYAAVVDEQIEALKQERLGSIRIYTDIYRRINRIDNEDERNVLRHKYIDLMNWNDVAIKMDYSLRQIHRFHGNALKHFEYEPEDIA